MIRYGWICRATQQKVQSYLTRHFQISNVLDPYIPKFKQPSFRALMAATDLVISGSVPLLLFSHAVWEPNNLNIYVDFNYCATVSSWLRDQGFVLGKMTRPVRSLDFLCHAQANRCTSATLTFDTSPRHLRHVPRYLNFQNTDTQKIIRLTLCDGTPVETVLKFHTSMGSLLSSMIFGLMTIPAAMVNIINHEAAYCLFPRATLERRLMVYQPFKMGVHPLPTDLYRLYRRRGFSFHRDWTPQDDATSPAVFPLGNRHVDDSFAFRVGWDQDLPLPRSTIGLHQWNIGFRPNTSCLTIQCTLCRSARLKHSYLLSGDLTFYQHIFDSLVTSHSDNRFVDFYICIHFLLTQGNRYLDTDFLNLTHH